MFEVPIFFDTTASSAEVAGATASLSPCALRANSNHLDSFSTRSFGDRVVLSILVNHRDLR